MTIVLPYCWQVSGLIWCMVPPCRQRNAQHSCITSLAWHCLVQHIAGHHPQLRLLGISTVAGNQTVDKTTANAVSMAAAAGLEVGERWVVSCMAQNVYAPSHQGYVKPAFDMQVGTQNLCLWLSRSCTAAPS